MNLLLPREGHFMFDRGNGSWRQRHGTRCISAIELSLTLSVILGLVFVSFRVMTMETPVRWHQTSITDITPAKADMAP